MRSYAEARLVYRKARTVFFGDCELTRIDKLNAAKRLRSKIRSLDEFAGNSTDIANAAVSDVRQELQIERSIRSIRRRMQHV
jgi:hypothetical protein